MKRNSSHGRSKLSDFLLIPPVAAFVSLGMVLPEYLLVILVTAFLAMTVLAIVQTIKRRDDSRRTTAGPSLTRVESVRLVETAGAPELAG